MLLTTVVWSPRSSPAAAPVSTAPLSSPASPAGTQIVTAAPRTAAEPFGAVNGDRTKSATT